MNIKDIQEQIQSYSKQTEEIFLSLAEKFPMLLNKDESSSMVTLLSVFNQLDKNNKEVIKQEDTFFSSYDKKYEPLFEQLNQKIEALATVNENVQKIKDNSEEMELIALNAMVISIKSGERGRAFSSITESLKQLSTDMNIYSNKLLEEEQGLLEQINVLKEAFGELMDYKKDLLSVGNSSSSDVSALIENASTPLDEIKSIIQSASSPILAAMEGLQLQDIIRQALDHILLCLAESSLVASDEEVSEETVDNISFNISLLRLAKTVLEDICVDIKKSIEMFSSNWQKVVSILEAIEPKRVTYVSRFLDKQNYSEENLHAKMIKINDHFSEILKQFSLYQSSQKKLERNCNGINEKAHLMYGVFEALKPIIDRLHHVRILQQIEVAKNPAIAAVKDSVIDMDNLISSANHSLDDMQDMLNGFIAGIKTLLSEFTIATKSDSIEMNKIRLGKNAFFNEFKNMQDKLSSIFSQFSVFPEGFEQLCKVVQGKLSELESIYDALRRMIVTMSDESTHLEEKKFHYLKELGLDSWEIKDDRLKSLVEKFTITAHKEQAGSIGNFGVEDGAESGEITFF